MMIEDINTTRALPIKGGFNFRDLGGLPTKDGKTIKKGLLIRSDELNNLEASDLDLLSQIGVKTTVDFRTEKECAKSIDRLPMTCKNQFHLPILSANMDSLMAEFKNGTANFKEIMFTIYKDLVVSENSHNEYSKFFEILQNPENNAVIYHCTAGKDRTGIATVLILEALNVDWSIIENDYLLSNHFLEKKYENYISKKPEMASLLMVEPAYLEYAIKNIKEKYTSIEKYLTTILNVDIDLMRSIYVE